MSRIYDSSAITQRRRDQAQAGSFINRIQNPNNPQTSYGPLQGNYDASIMNSVKMGQPKEFYRNSGCIIISNGCPCPPIAVDEIVSGSGPTPPVILAPGSVSNITVEYGSVIVRWNAPTKGGAPTSYTLIADDQTNSANSVTITGIPSTIYTFPTYTGPAVDQLTAGNEYLFSVIAVNSAGSSTADVSSSFYAPYIAPISTTTSVEYLPNRIDITLTPYAVFTPATYNLKTYTNNELTSTSTSQTYSSNLIIVNTNLSCLNVYTFQVQLLGSSDEYSSFSVKGANVPVYPYGPNFLSSPNDVTNITTTTAQVNYADYTIEGFDLTTGNAECILNSVPAIGYTQLTNTSVTLSGLTAGTNYPSRSITISFRKTIQGNVITSPPLSLPAFTTANIIPGSVSNILAIYGTTGTNVTWDAPTSGGTVTSYTLFANDRTTPANSVTITGITDVSYIFPTYTGPALNQLTAGDEYLFSVTAVNSAGSGAAEVSSSFYAPYSAASGVSAQGFIADPNMIFINFSAYEFGTGLPPTYYTVIQYTNGTYATTTTALYGTNQIVINSGLNGTDDYSFQFQLSRPGDNKYTSYTPLTIPTKTYPPGPTGINYSNLSSTGIQIIYDDFSTTGYELSGATCTITNGITPLTIQAGSLTNTSVIVESLSPVTPYAGYTISFSKSPYNPSAPSNLTTFTTNGIAPINVSALAPSSGNNATIVFNEYILGIGHPGEFNFDDTSIVSIPGASPNIQSIISSSEIYIGSLSPATTYSGCRLILKNIGGDISDPSNTFTIVTKSYAVTNLAFSSSTQTTVNLTFTKPGTLPGTIQNVYAYYGSSQFGSVNLVSQTELQITGLSVGTTYDDVTIVLSDGTYLSMPSNALLSISTLQAAPVIQNISNITWTTADIEFQSYHFGDQSDPTGAIVTSATHPNISNSLVSTSTDRILYLSPGVTYTDLNFVLTGSGGLQSSEAAVSTFTTAQSTGNFDSIGLNYTTTSTAVYQVNVGFIWIPTTTYIIGNLGSNPTQPFAASLTPLFNDIYEIMITGLTSNTTYNNIKIALTDGGNEFSELRDVGSFTTLQPTSPAPVMTIIDDLITPIRANVTGVYNGSTVAITFTYTQYAAFTPTSGELLDINNNPVGTFVSVDNISLVISGILPAYYTDYKIRLYGDSASSQITTPFNFTAIPILNVRQDPTPSSNPITIKYDDMYVNFSGFNVSSGYIYVPELSNFPYSSNQAFNDASQFSPSGIGSYNNCYIVLINTGSSRCTLYSSRFTVEITT